MEETSAHRSAHEDLRYIRRALAAAGHLSIVSGVGLAGTGVMACGAVAVNLFVTGAPWDSRQSPVQALLVWAVLLVASVCVGAWTMMRKARRTEQVFWSPVLRKALWGYAAAMLLGGMITFVLVRSDLLGLIPIVWLGCYGVALTSAGAFSVSPVRWMGACFLLLAAVAAVSPVAYGLLLLGLGFGWLHLSFGVYIAWRHDG